MMNYLNRAIKNVVRRPSKSILLALTFFVIGNLVIVGLGISSAAENAKTLTRKQMRAVISYEVDYQKFYQDAEDIENEDEREEFFSNYPKISMESSKEMLADERVVAADFFGTWERVYADEGIEYVKNPYADENSMYYGSITLEDGTEIPYVPPVFRVQANIMPNQIALHDKTYEIVEGRYYSQEDIDNNNKVCLITDELAELNNLHVGDTFSIVIQDPTHAMAQFQQVGMEYNPDDNKIEMEIIGIFHNNNVLDDTREDIKYLEAAEMPGNVVLMPSSTYKLAQYEYNKVLFDVQKQLYPEMESEFPTFEEYNEVNTAVFLLDDPLEVEKFVDDYEGKVADYTFLNANNEEFIRLSRPLDTLTFFSNIIVGIVVFNAVVIITLVTALTLKTRSYEIGVLLSMGVSKVKVVMQLFVELLIVALLGFTLSVASGSLIAGKVGESVLAYQVTTEEKYEEGNDHYYEYIDPNSYFTEVSQEDILSKYEVRVSPVLIAEIYVLGLGVVFVSILIPSVMIMRFNPKQILLNTN